MAHQAPVEPKHVGGHDDVGVFAVAHRHTLRIRVFVSVQDFTRDRIVGEDDDVDRVVPMVVDRLDMFFHTIARGFPGLGHRVAEVDFDRLAVADRLPDFLDDQVGKDAGIERTDPVKDVVSVFDGFKRLPGRPDFFFVEDAANPITQFRDVGFAAYNRPVLHFGEQGDDLAGRREDVAFDVEDVGNFRQRFHERSAGLRQCGQDQIPQVVSAEFGGNFTRVLKAVTHQVRQQAFTLGHGDHDVA